MQLTELLGGSPVLAKLKELEDRLDAATARSEAALRSALTQHRSVPKRLRLSLSHTHANQRKTPGGTSMSPVSDVG